MANKKPSHWTKAARDVLTWLPLFFVFFSALFLMLNLLDIF